MVEVKSTLSKKEQDYNGNEDADEDGGYTRSQAREIAMEIKFLIMDISG